MLSLKPFNLTKILNTIGNFEAYITGGNKASNRVLALRLIYKCTAKTEHVKSFIRLTQTTILNYSDTTKTTYCLLTRQATN